MKLPSDHVARRPGAGDVDAGAGAAAAIVLAAPAVVPPIVLLVAPPEIITPAPVLPRPCHRRRRCR